MSSNEPTSRIMNLFRVPSSALEICRGPCSFYAVASWAIDGHRLLEDDAGKECLLDYVERVIQPGGPLPVEKRKEGPGHSATEVIDLPLSMRLTPNIYISDMRGEKGDTGTELQKTGRYQPIEEVGENGLGCRIWKQDTPLPSVPSCHASR